VTTNSIRANTQALIFVTLVFSWVGLLNSCTTNIDMSNALDDRENKASVVAKNSEIIYTEKGRIKLKIIAPLTKYFQSHEEPYTEFPNGITVYTYSDSMEVESELTAKYATYYDRKGLWSASNDVVAKNSKGEKLNTEHLFWDQTKKIIYTDDMVKITTSDGVQYGQGFTSDETFNNWEIKKPNSYYYLDNNQEVIDSTSNK
jgi:LPS export ABC transporter protein LptC